MHGDDRAVAALAAAQHGVVHVEQLRSLGLERGPIQRRIRAGRLRPIFRGVYLFGAVVPALGEEQAALLAAGAGALLGGGTGARLYELAAGATVSPIEVLVVGRDLKSRDGLRIHRVQHLADDEAAQFQGLAITTPARVILDVAPRLSPKQLERTIADAFRRGLAEEGELERLVTRHAGRPGAPALRDVLQIDGGPAFTRREAEERLLHLIRAAGLPAPAVNASVCGLQVDLVWHRERLVVEFDGFRYHGDRIAFERDRARDARLLANGYRVLRITWRRLRDNPHEVIAQIAAALTTR